jgi:hypothetical protein
MYIPVPEPLWDLPSSTARSANAVWEAIIRYLPPDRPILTCTDAQLATAPSLRNWSLQFVQKGLRTLEALGIIERKRRYGRRTITVLIRLRTTTAPRPSRTAPYKRHAAAGKPLPAPPPKPHNTYNPQAYQPFTKPQRSTPEQHAQVKRFLRDEMHLLIPEEHCNPPDVSNSCISRQASAKNSAVGPASQWPADG